MGDRRLRAAGHDQRVEVVKLFDLAHRDHVGAYAFEHRRVFSHVALKGENADAWHLYQPRSARRCSKEAISMPFIAAPSPVETLATTCASRKCVVASTMALAIRSGSSLLKMPEPTKRASAPSCSTSEASAGVEMPPAQKSGTGSLPVSETSWTRASGACRSFARRSEERRVGKECRS